MAAELKSSLRLLASENRQTKCDMSANPSLLFNRAATNIVNSSVLVCFSQLLDELFGL